MTKPAPTRNGTTHTVRTGYATTEITLNRWEGGAEVFAKFRYNAKAVRDVIEGIKRDDPIALQIVQEALSAPQGYLDRICTLASLAMQGRGDAETVARHLCGDKSWPRGTAGQASSPIDAIGRVLQERAENATLQGSPEA
jgi:hypothetical protein